MSPAAPAPPPSPRALRFQEIRALNRMLAEKELLATKLFAQYRQVQMPNLRLSQPDVDALLAYFEAESGCPDQP